MEQIRFREPRASGEAGPGSDPMVRTMFLRTALAALAVFSAGQTMAAGPYDAPPVIIGNHYEHFLRRVCSGETCMMRFAAPPAGRTLVIKQVACMIASQGAQASVVRLDVQGQILAGRTMPLPIALVATAGEEP